MDHNWEFINEVEDWIHIPVSNSNSHAPRPILEAQLIKAVDMLQEAKDRLVLAQQQLDDIRHP